MLDDEGYDAVSGRERIPLYRRWRSPDYWIALLFCVGAAAALIPTVGGGWFMIPMAAWPVAGYAVDRRLEALR